MKKFLYSLILPLTSFSFILFTLLIALGNFLYYFSYIDIGIEMVVFFNLLWVFFYACNLGHDQKQN